MGLSSGGVTDDVQLKSDNEELQQGWSNMIEPETTSYFHSNANKEHFAP